MANRESFESPSFLVGQAQAETDVASLDTQPRATNMGRWRVGSAQRVIHALVLAFLQPIIPIVLLSGLRRYLFSRGGALLSPNSVSFAAVLLASAVLLSALGGVGLLMIGRIRPGHLGFRLERWPFELLLGVVGLFTYLACFALITHVLLPESSMWRLSATYSWLQRLLLLAVGATIAAFEESVFRGYLQPTLIHLLGLGPGIALTAVVFAAWHPTPHHLFTLPGFLVRLSLGLITGLCRGKDRPLTASIVTHALVWSALGLT